MMHPTVARLTLKGLLGRRRTILLVALPVLLIVISVAVRALSGQDDSTSADILSGFALGTMVPIIGVMAGTGAIGPEIDDGSIVYLLAKPITRPTIVLTKLVVAICVTVAFAAVPTFIAGLALSGTSQRIAIAFGIAATASSVAYAAIFLLLGVVTRHAVVVGLVYALVWEGLLGSLISGAKTLSVQQWSLSLAEKIAANGVVDSDVGLPTALVLMVVVTVGTTWFAGQKLRSLTLAGEE
ncbi:ABC transporter permease [Wenjunlia tyrosinilytica]|nr:ABC transporter permease subunit [Wenjunlia tyrosinilytica]